MSPGVPVFPEEGSPSLRVSQLLDAQLSPSSHIYSEQAQSIHQRLKSFPTVH